MIYTIWSSLALPALYQPLTPCPSPLSLFFFPFSAFKKRKNFFSLLLITLASCALCIMHYAFTFTFTPRFLTTFPPRLRALLLITFWLVMSCFGRTLASCFLLRMQYVMIVDPSRARNWELEEGGEESVPRRITTCVPSCLRRDEYRLSSSLAWDLNTDLPARLERFAALGTSSSRYLTQVYHIGCSTIRS